ncbi:Gfo/Idh/MocA family protein [Larkinella soli]|uniref:Gfo/Idh/MocA family protein n=1 Tax=Larkinella soli TaxID=1770527 RepID=UPI000FFC1ED3|nr:Gfo/Idh/MocA family oxidoreductase [Larkinella soli]
MASRRIFLQQAGLVAASVAYSPLTLAGWQKKDRLGIALVGLGYYSTDLLAPALQQTKKCYLAGIVTGTPSKAEQWMKKYNLPEKNVYNYQNFDQIANNKDIDVVYVVLPPSMHREYVIRAANAGKHVWCEKPMAITERECQDMIDACRKNKQKLAIGYRLQHEPNTKQYVKLLRDGKIGKIKTVNCAAGYVENRTNHWKQKKELGGGVMYDMGVYSLQGARLATGEEPISLTAEQSTSRPEIYKNGLDETSVARLVFPSGAVANIRTSFGQNVNYLKVVGEKGTLNMEPYSAYAGVKGEATGGIVIDHPYQVPWQQANQMDDDADHILNNRAMPVPGEEGLKDIRIVEAIYRAAKSGQSVKLT